MDDKNQNSKYNPDFLKSTDLICEADPRNSSISIIDPKNEKFRSKKLPDHYRSVSRYVLKTSVPKDIVIQFETAKNLYLYAWFVYRFYPVAEHHSLICLEFALRERFKGKLPKKYWNAKRPPTLRPLLKYAIDFKYIENEGFQQWHQDAEIRAIYRYQTEKLQEMNEKGLNEIELDFSEVEILDKDRDWNYLNILLKKFPNFRNHYAHGCKSLYIKVLGTIQIVKDIINQIYP